MSLISQTQTYTNAGTYTYTIPAGVSTLEFHLWGAGGASGETGSTINAQVGTVNETVQSGFTLVQTGVQQVQAGTTQIQTGTTQIQTGTSQIQTGTAIVQTGTRQVQTGTIQVQTGTRQEAYVVTVSPPSNSKGSSSKNNGKNSGVRTETRYRDVPVFENRPVFTTIPVYETQTLFETIPTFVTVPVYGTQPVFVDQPIQELQPTFSTVAIPTFEAKSGGAGGVGGGGGYSYKKIQVSQGDEIAVYVGSSGVRNVGGVSLTTPVDYSGGDTGSASNGGRGGGGGGATVITLNGTVIAVAAGGGGGGGGGTLGRVGDPGSPAVTAGIASGERGRGRSSNSGPATGGAGGGGYYGGAPGSSGATGGAGFGGVSLGTVIQSGSGSTPGGRTVPAYPGRNAGSANVSGAAVLVFTKSFNINVKQTNNWKFIDNAWVKVDGGWKDILNGWVKVDGVWEPLITARSIEGAENLAAPAITYGLSANRSNVAEGSAVSFTVSTTGLTSGNLVPYSVSGIDPSDLQVGSISGSFTVGTGETITFVPRENNATNGVRNLRVVLDNTEVSAVCAVLDTSLTPFYTILPNVSVINENQAVRFTLGNANGIAGENINYTITGIAASRISSGSLTGTFVVGSSEQTTIAVGADNTTTGNTLMTMSLVGKSALTTVTVVDTSLTPVYTVSADQSTINEGQPVTFTLGTLNAVIGHTVDYIITGIEASRITSGALTGSFVVGSTESVTILVAEDEVVTGNTVMTMRLTSRSTSSVAVTVVDTSVPPAGRVAFNSSGSWTVPAGVTSINILIAGAGGGGGPGHSTGCGNTKHIGGAGGAAEIEAATRSVTPGQVITFTVGSGGSGGTLGSPSAAVGANGADSVILDITARGGLGGIFGTSKGPGASGTSYSSGSGGYREILKRNGLNTGGGGAGGAYRSAGNAGGGGSVLIVWGQQF
jgi:X-X-X-Leu-X-X-Gly heptad repeat protein